MRASLSTPSMLRCRALMALLMGLSLTLTACGGGGGGGFGGSGGSSAAIETDNQTDIYGPPRVMTEFYLSPAASGSWSGNLLGDFAYPGEVHYLGTYFEDYYDAEAWLADSPDVLVQFFDEPAYAGFTNTFEVY